MKVRITVRPGGYISIGGRPLTAWPPAGSVVDLPDKVAEDLINAGRAEKVVGRPPSEWLWPWLRRPAKRSGPTTMKVRMKVSPTGYLSIGGGPLSAWPSVGAVADLPSAIAESLIAGGFAEQWDGETSVPTVRLRVKRAWPQVGAMVDVPEAIASTLTAAGFTEEVRA